MEVREPRGVYRLARATVSCRA